MYSMIVGTDAMLTLRRFVRDLPPGFHRMNEDLVNAQFPPEVQPVQVRQSLPNSVPPAPPFSAPCDATHESGPGQRTVPAQSAASAGTLH
jgi:hypothetical protein